MRIALSDIVNTVTRATGRRQDDVELVLERAIETVIVALSRGDSVLIRGFGTFRLKRYPPGTVNVNPRGVRTVRSEWANSVSFRPASKVKHRLQSAPPPEDL